MYPIFIKKFSEDVDERLESEIFFRFEITVHIPHQFTLYYQTVCKCDLLSVAIPEKPVYFALPVVVVTGVYYYYAGSIGQLGTHGIGQDKLLGLFQEKCGVAMEDHDGRVECIHQQHFVNY